MKNSLNSNYLFLLVFFFSLSIQAQSYWDDDFSSSNFRDDYDISHSQNFKHIPNGGPEGDGCVEITIEKDHHHGGSMRYMFQEKLGFEPEEVYAEYSVSYDKDMKEYGGKGPGFSGTYDETGWGNRPGYGKGGWSARGGVNCDNQPYAKNSWYVYHTYTNYDAPDCPGDDDYRNCNPFPYDVPDPGSQPYASTKTWGSSLNWGNKGNMEFNQWYDVKQYIKLNTPGQNNGILRVWVNGELANEFTNVNFRRINDLKIFAYWFNYYNGGPSTIRETGHVRIDNFKLYGANGESCTPGNSCDDEDVCTTNDVFDSNCNCSGIPVQDSDNDGICDTNDQCPNFDDSLIGTSCDDGDQCTFGDIYTTDCNCKGVSESVVTFEAIEDAFIQSEGDAINNNILRIQDNDRRVSYLKYNLSTLSEDVNDIKLSITTKTDTGDGTIEVYLSNNVNWSETNLTSANAPNPDMLVGSINDVYEENKNYTIDLNGLPINTPFSLILKQQSGNDVAFASSEYDSQSVRPVLKATVIPDNCQLSILENELRDKLKTYPNPIENMLTISHTSNLDLEITIFNIMGKKLISLNSNKQLTNLDVSKISSRGIYMLSIKDKNTSTTIFEKLIKQ